MTATATPDHDPKPTFRRSLEALLARADAGTGPHSLAAALTSLPFGAAIAQPDQAGTGLLDQQGWEALHRTLAPGRLPEVPQTPDAIADAAGDAAVSVGLLTLRYQRPSARLMACIEQAERDDTAIDVPDGPLMEPALAFAASALLPPTYWGFERQPDVHPGLDVQFHLDPAWVVADAGAPDSIAVDFDDGQGFRPWAIGGRQAVRYDRGGARRIVLRAVVDGQERTAAFRFQAEPATAPEPDLYFLARAIRPHNGVTHECRVCVYYAAGRTRIARPFIIAEGFPGGARPADLYDRINGKAEGRFNPDAGLADALRQQGFDLLLLFFDDGGAELQGNAFAYLGALREIWQRMDQTGEIIAGGGSMGGLIARYALAYAQTHGEPTGNVTALMTFDSPHMGANVPYGVQCAARYFRDHAPAQNKMLDLRSARQMLIAQRRTGDQADEPWQKEEFTGFYKELRSLGKDGYPTGIRTYAISNGAADGARGIGPFEQAVRWTIAGGLLGLAEVFAAPNGTRFRLAMCGKVFHRQEYSIGDYYGVDGVAGGTSPFFGQLADALERSGWGALHPPVVRDACFVPAYSALGYAVTGDPYRFRPDSLTRSDVPFTDWYVSPTNEPHATVTKAIKEWVLGVLLKPGREASYYITWNRRSLSGNFSGLVPRCLEILRPDRRLPLTVVQQPAEGTTETCVLRVMEGDKPWYVSDRPCRGTGYKSVLELVDKPFEAVRLTAVFNHANRTVSFRRVGGPGTPALTLDTGGYGIRFEPLQERNALPIVQHFDFEPVPPGT